MGFQILCLDDWGDIAYEVTGYAYYACAIFVSFVVISSFVIINLFIAVICEALQILRAVETAMEDGELTAGEDTENKIQEDLVVQPDPKEKILQRRVDQM